MEWNGTQLRHLLTFPSTFVIKSHSQPASQPANQPREISLIMSDENKLARPPDDAVGEMARFDRCFSGLDFAMESRQLKELDPEKLKKEIKRWAKAVVAFAARQLSFGSREKGAESSSRGTNGREE